MIMKYFLLSVLGLFITVSCNDDTEPMNVGDPRLVVYNLSFDELDDTHEVTYYIRMMGTISVSTPVDFRTIDKTAIAGTDYEAKEGQVTFEPGETIKEISLTILGNLIEQPERSFTIEFTSPFGDFDDVKVEITINDDDGDINSGELVIPETGYITPDSYPGMSLVWQDEFKQGALDGSSWSHDTGTGCPNLCGWGNNELQYYQADNLTMEEGEYLVIEARRQVGGNNDYSSSRITTKDKREFQYGRVDIRAAMPEGRGVWPALWMLGSNIDSSPWPSCGEIDIFELRGDEPGRAYGTVHYGASYEERMFNTSTKDLASGEKFKDEFHVFSLVWEEDLIQILLDDVVYQTFTPGNTGGQPYPFNQPFYFLFNIAVGGDFPGNPDATTVFPQYMIVDYIRVFQ
jgi:beta-glucanase (GH16 family)